MHGKRAKAGAENGSSVNYSLSEDQQIFSATVGKRRNFCLKMQQKLFVGRAPRAESHWQSLQRPQGHIINCCI